MAPVIVAFVLLVPALAAAQQTAPGQAIPPPAAPAAAAPAPTKEPAMAPGPAAVPAAPGTLAPAAAPGTVATTPPKEEYASYVVLKGGWFGSADEFQGESFDGAGEWELAVGTGRILGIELGGGSMTTSAGGLEVRTIPLLLTLRLQIPIAMFAPHLDAGAGVYFNRATVGNADVDDTTAGWHAGVGCDLLLRRLVVGADVRYMGIAPTFSTIGKVTLDRYAVLLKAGVRF